MSPPASGRGPWCTPVRVLLFGVLLVGNRIGGPHGGPPQPSSPAVSAASLVPVEARGPVAVR